MPPHCDSLDGPVVTAARKALEERDIDQVLPYLPEEGEREVREAFELTAKARTLGQEAQEVADRWFFETVVRVHRSGEGAPFTGLKPAGLNVGPVIPAAERALDADSADELTGILCGIVREQVEERHGRAMALKEHATEGVAAARAYVEASLGLQVWAHHLYKQAIAVPDPPTRRS
ncbi:DUF6448 family protein [Streptomyces sp. NL15-2K]|uniref:DUF6448 family protein n=1 Tax=Streptomyces sp. NL15-2K TaxID=376149 RepID=UPI000F55C5AD|nr:MULTISPECIES: DUF6448 family protein [Actinomycetes]WKX16322.1 DUF6448 family protein [Kutzneria buriramensis]GCB50761.1 hypothetical protein SNL152K_8107 [Streptomyces sp. NL15-2K]